MKEQTTLAELQAGSLFIFNGRIGFKSEYRTDKGAIEAYCYESGEMFWGGAQGAHLQTQLIVEPIVISGDELLNALALYFETKKELEDGN